MNSAFRPHGKFSTRIGGRLMVSDITGPWNKDRLHCIAHVIVADASVDGRDFLEPVFARIYDGVVARAAARTRRRR